MTRYFAPIGALLLAAVLTAFGQGADERYIWIYTLIQEADNLSQKGSKTEAVNKYTEAQGLLRELQKLFPDWNPKVVNYRLGYVAEKLEPLAVPAPQAAPNPASKLVATASADLSGKGPADAPPPPAAEQWKAAQEELAKLTSQNALLQAKLKEALSVQPSGTDPRELAKAEDQIRALQKEKDLLQLRLEQEQAKAAKIPDPAVLEQERQLVAELKQKLARQTELAAALQQENATLKLRIEDLKYPAALPSNKASEQLEIAKTTISALQATNIALRSEQIILEARMGELSKNFVSKSVVEKLEREPLYATRIDALKTELLSRPEIGRLAQDLWSGVRDFVAKNASGETDVLQRHLAGAFVAIGHQLASDANMRGEINQGMVIVLRSFVAEQKSGVSTFIADQVKAWDMRQLIALIETNIGKDLQYIRFNGTVIGGLAGLSLHGMEVLIRAL